MHALKKILVLILLTITFSCQNSKEAKVFTEKDIVIIPKPVALTLEQGAFQFNKHTQFVISDASQKAAASVLIEKFKNAAGWILVVSEKAPKNNFIEFIKAENLGD